MKTFSRAPGRTRTGRPPGLCALGTRRDRDLNIRIGAKSPALRKNGSIICWVINKEPRKGIVIQAEDEGPGIPDVDAVLKDGYSTSGGLGLGLPGVRRMMDEFAIVSHPGRGTTVTAIKWKE